MLRHYLKLAFRSFKTNRLLWLVSIPAGLSSAFCISLLLLYVHSELTMDEFHERKNDIHLMTIQMTPQSEQVAMDFKGFFRFDYRKYPEIDAITVMQKYAEGELRIKYQQTVFTPEVIIAYGSFFQIFDFKLKSGDESKVMNMPQTACVTERFAKKMFGNENPVGKIVTVTDLEDLQFTIQGVIETPPSNSSITFDVLLSDVYDRGKFSRSGVNFILCNKNFNKEIFNSKIENIGRVRSKYSKSKVSIMSLDEIYFGRDSATNYLYIFSRFGSKRSIQILLLIGLAILIISVTNFTNLNFMIANSSIKQLCINKLNGASGWHLLVQKTISSILFVGFLSITLTMSQYFLLPYFKTLFKIEFAPSWWIILLTNFVVVSVIVFISDVYPFATTMRIQMVHNINKYMSDRKWQRTQNLLTIVQYSIAIILLISSVVMAKQLRFILGKDLGFTYNNIVKAKMVNEVTVNVDEFWETKIKKHLQDIQYIKDKMASNPNIEGFSFGASPLKYYSQTWKLDEGNIDFASQNAISMSPNAAKIFDLKLEEGRFFDETIDNSQDGKVVINEAAKKYFGITDITKVSLKLRDQKYQIIGVVKDFNYEHLSVAPSPLIINSWAYVSDLHFIRIKSGATKNTLQFLQKLFKEVNPDQIFQYSFLSEDITLLYEKERRTQSICTFFTIVAILISSIGLFITAFHDTDRRTKEIGIRKVNGAKISEVLIMLNRDFVKWVAIAFVIATPIAYYAMNKWLENFAYKTELSWWIFALAGLVALGIALLTVSWQSWRAATRNPVEALRSE